MSLSLVETVGVMIACVGAAGALVLVSPQRRYLAMGVALAAAAALLIGEIAGQGRFDDLASEPAAIVLGLVLGGTALGATAATFNRVPAAFVVAAVAVLPLRAPIQIGGETNFLLVPLYGVIAGGFLRAAWICVRRDGSELVSATAPSRSDPAAVRYLVWALAASIVVYGIGTTWSADPENSIRTVAFFLVPFAALFALMRDIRWHRTLVWQVLAASVVVALGFAALALYQHESRNLTLNNDLQFANELHLYFRVNSLFRDPNVLGRYLVFAIIAVATWIAWRKPGWLTAGAAFGVGVLFVALTFTYSQTSYAALLAGLGVLAWFRLGRAGLAVAAATAVAGFAAVALLGGPDGDTSIDSGRTDLAETSSGRTSLIDGGIDLWLDEPFVGQGAGEFTIAFRRDIERVSRPVSHTEPVTVAAEQGVLGLLPYGAVLLFSFLVLFRPWPGAGPARAGLAAIYVALLVHTLGYAGFLIDPATWAILAIGIVLARTGD